jgi:hypothetical protein
MRRLLPALSVAVVLCLATGAPLVNAEDTPPVDTTVPATPPNGETPPSGTGTPSEPAPVLGEANPAEMPTAPGTSETAPDGSEPTEQPAPLTMEGDDAYGACANQAPVISGQLLVRTMIAAGPADQVVELKVTAENARVKEIEVPYHDWTVRYDGAEASASGPAAQRPAFWFWVALDQVDPDSTSIVVKSYATLEDGRVIAHDLTGAGQPADGRFAATEIPVTPEILANESVRDPDAPADAPEAARETPLNGRTPCRIGEAPSDPDSDSRTGLLLGLGGGMLLGGALTALLLRRRRA